MNITLTRHDISRHLFRMQMIVAVPDRFTGHKHQSFLEICKLKHYFLLVSLKPFGFPFWKIAWKLLLIMKLI